MLKSGKFQKFFLYLVLASAITVQATKTGFGSSGLFVKSDNNLVNNDTIQQSSEENAMPTISDEQNPLLPSFVFDEPPHKGVSLADPPNVTTEIIYDPENNQYLKVRKVGDRVVGRPVVMGFDDFLEYDMNKGLQNYWREKSRPQDFQRRDGLIPEIYVSSELFDRIFGGDKIDIRPTGSAELIFGVMSNKRDDPSIDERRRRHTNFDFQQKIQANVDAEIGEKIRIRSNYNTESTFDFENNIKIEYQGTEDEILQLVEAGDVTLPLPGTLITGSQGLFGIKTQWKFGNTTITSVFSQQKTETQTIEVSGGAQTSEFEIRADEYEENRHFFLGQHLRDQYDHALSELPVVKSNVNITRMEVWVTNVGAATEDNRNIVAFADLGEANPHMESIVDRNNSDPYPANDANQLYREMRESPIRDISQVNSYLSPRNYRSGVDYENIENARRLRSNEYTFNSKLGFISLNQTINPDQVLAVAFEYTLIGDDKTYRVGEFSNDVSAPQSLIVKMLKSTSSNTNIPMWDLMMKNVYNIGAFRVNREDFRLNVLYDSEEQGIPVGFLDEGPEDVKGEPLIRVMGLDRLNTQLDPYPDGVFDFIDNAATQGGTIESSNGRVFFPVVEPFGSHLRKMLEDADLADKYAFDSLYTTTKHRARQFPEKNRFFLEGMYKSEAGSEINLNAMNIPQGSVIVTAGGAPLTENVDYTVDYTIGRVQIINEGILNSGTPIRISLESSDIFGMKTKTLMGAHVNHRVSDDFDIGGTILRLSERPLTQKVNYGDDPIANTIWGLNTTYTTESLFLTRMLDWLPFYSSTRPSRITFDGEFAHLIPGHSRHIGDAGTVYIDDFEGSKSTISLKHVHSWHHASTPQYQTTPGMFPEGAPGTGLAFRKNVGNLAWYIIDPIFVNRDTRAPNHIRNDLDQLSNHFVRAIYETEIWPYRESRTDGLPAPLSVLNLAFYPKERGPYNYDATPSVYSAGMAHDGYLNNPETRWGGIMRGLSTTDFEAANVEYIEFWLMDPFVNDDNDEHEGGDLYFNLGDVSEDVLRDGRKSFENGLPIGDGVVEVDTTIWGVVPTQQDITGSFDNDPQSRQYQDVGLDGLSTEDERDHKSIKEFLNNIADLYGEESAAYQIAYADPSADNFKYYRSSVHDQNRTGIIERYKRYNNPEGNSPTAEMSEEPYSTASTRIPDTEDINRDGTLNESERYFQYRVSLRPEDMVVGQNYITDKMEANVRLANGETESVSWYQFKIPLKDPNRQAINDIQDFKSIRFMRMFLKGFEDSIICRFATLALVRGDWRTYDRSLTSPGEYVPTDDDDSSFDVFTVNIEENAHRQPIPYVLPPGVEREVDLGTTALRQRNEQSLAMRVHNLKDGDARAVYKTTSFDMRQYKRLRMFSHIESLEDETQLNDGDLRLFIRIGTDLRNNYYEYEIPMKVSQWGAFNPREVWPEENEFDIYLEKFQELKLERNSLSREANSGVSINRPFSIMDGENIMTIIGTPTLSDVKSVMIGVRNPKKTMDNSADDGMPKSAEIWVNELRLHDFDDQGGWAASGRINATLADLGNLTIAGMVSTPGFGSIEQKVDERQKENYTSYDISSNLELGRFFPEDFGLRIPLHFSFSEAIINPQYNPLNPDILLQDDLESYETQEEKEEIEKLVQDVTRRKSINFSNVSKTRTASGATPRLWDIENFNFTFAFTEFYARNIDIEYDSRKTWMGGLGYNYSNTPQNVTPLANISFLSHDAFRLIRDFNFYYKPRSLSFRTEIDRGYNEVLLRSKSDALIILEPNYIKTFNWDRIYNMNWDLTRSLKLEYSALNNARIDEPEGRIDRSDQTGFYDYRQEVFQNIQDFGRTTYFDQRVNLTYNIPVNKLPLLDWINANANYTANFNWEAAPRATEYMGNTIENSNTKGLNINANFVNLYNKIDFLQQINSRQSLTRQETRSNAARQPMPGQTEEEEEDDEVDYLRIAFESFARILMGFRNASLSYSESSGSRLPGFQHSPQAIGQNWDVNAPGMGFILGDQTDIREQAAREGWFVDFSDDERDFVFNQPFTQNKSQNISGRVTFEPIPNLTVNFTGLRNTTTRFTEYFEIDDDGRIVKFNPRETGNFSISYLSINTIFDDVDERTHRSENFENFKYNRFRIAERLALENPNWQGEKCDSTGYPLGYGPTSQSVLISTFMATYGGKDIDDSPLNPFLNIPYPNWQVTYNGLTQLDFFQRYFRSITISHRYSSTFNISSFESNIEYDDKNTGHPALRDDYFGNFIPKYQFGQVSISEQFNPLINIDMTWQNRIMTRLEYRHTRNLTLGFSNNQITEVISREYIIGTGYRFENLAFNIAQGGGSRRIESDLVLRMDLAIRNNITILRKLVEDQDTPSAGQQNISINLSADYQVTPQLNFRFFYDHIITNPHISNQIPTSNIHSGISLRFMLR